MKPIPLAGSCVVIGLYFVGTVTAASLDPTKYGELKQSDLARCGAQACGPAAAVNSFVYLQDMYPDVYNSFLVGLDPHPPLHWQQLAGDLLSMPEYMDTCCGLGTPIEKFIIGKERYIEERIPNKTRYQARIDTQWRPAKAGTPTAPVPKPSYVIDQTAPNVAFLLRQIEHGEDVELFLHYLSGRQGDHYVTLFKFSPLADGELNFIDPITGKPLTEDAVYETERVGFRTYIKVTYFDPADPNNIIEARITGAVSESPIPEPGTVTLVTIGLVGLGIKRARGRGVKRAREHSMSPSRPKR